MRGIFPLILLLVTISFLPPLTLSLTHPDDITALKSFKSSINPSSIPQWSCLASWDFSAADPCALPHRTHFLCGVTCTPSSTHIETITLDSSGYTGTLTPLLSKLTHLTHLDLTDNSFHGSIPFSSLPSTLQSLSLSGNSFSGSIPLSISKLTSLQSLDLSNNHLTGSIPNTLPNNLTRLDLTNNKLTGSIPTLPSTLIVLVIRSNSLSGPLPKPSFTLSNNLQVIDLSTNSLSGTLPSWFLNLPSLQQLNLSNNTITSIELPPTTTGQQLVSVDLSFNRIEGYLPPNFARFPSLWALSMRYNRLVGRIPDEFGGKNSKLKRLFLDGNFLIGKLPKGLLGGEPSVAAGSFGDNCLEECPVTSRMCLPSQKPLSVCRRVYRGKKRGKRS